MTDPARHLAAKSLLAAAALALAAVPPGAEAASCTPPVAAPPLRRGGTAQVKITGTVTAQGTYPAACGAYVLADVPKVAKAGDGLAFITCIPGVGTFQVSGTKRQAGLSGDAGVVLNADASYLGSAGKEVEVKVGADLFGATVKATLRPMGRPKPGQPRKEIRVEARFDCPR
jgi:hypothetical protein